jgi:hypothetical protein
MYKQKGQRKRQTKSAPIDPENAKTKGKKHTQTQTPLSNVHQKSRNNSKYRHKMTNQPTTPYTPIKNAKESKSRNPKENIQ